MDDNSFYQDGDVSWMVTGDQATMEFDGSICITGRYKDLIIRAEQNISPASIETLLDADEIAGELPVAIIYPPLSHVKPEDLYELVRIKLGKHYVPERILTLNDLSLEDWPKR